VKVLNHSGYDVMTIEVEERPWWYAIFNKAPKVEKYTGHDDKWRDSHGAIVHRKKALELGDIWVRLRDEMKAERNQRRGR
jgi:hypothetical protein